MRELVKNEGLHVFSIRTLCHELEHRFMRVSSLKNLSMVEVDGGNSARNRPRQIPRPGGESFGMRSFGKREDCQRREWLKRGPTVSLFLGGIFSRLGFRRFAGARIARRRFDVLDDDGDAPVRRV